ncbi:MAG: hypothetical protein LBQ55_07515 [Treponema sp.]|nr:hypothetical protein [Treponema sp.]
MIILLQALSLFPQETVVENLTQLDGETAKVGNLVAGRLNAIGQGTVVRVGTFVLHGSNSTLGAYWSQQLLSVLSERKDRNYSLFVGVSGGGNLSSQIYLLSGEILRMENTVRIYTRLSGARDGQLLNSWITDLRNNTYVNLLIRNALPSSSSERGSLFPDAYEIDGRENPLAVEIGGPRIDRTLHDGEDEDWFTVTADQAGTLIFETFGSLDTVMQIYGGGSGDVLDENDDGGTGSNARITIEAEQGSSYLIKIKGYDRSETGNYQFQVRYRSEG